MLSERRQDPLPLYNPCEIRLMYPSNRHTNIVAAWRAEMNRAEAFLLNREIDSAFRHFERAHILGQRFTVLHLRSHWGMFRVGWRRKDVRELLGGRNIVLTYLGSDWKYRRRQRQCISTDAGPR